MVRSCLAVFINICLREGPINLTELCPSIVRIAESMASKEIGWKQFDPTETQLAQTYYAGLRPKEFARTTRLQDVETICISSLCDEVMLYVAKADNKKKIRLSIAFSDLSYIWFGILTVFEAQIKILYDEAMRQAHYTLEYVKKTQTIIALWQKPTKSSLSKSRSRKNDEQIDHLPNKRVKFANAEFDWQSLNDSEVDDESTIKILQTSKVMNRDQISLREVISEQLPDVLSQYNDFEAAESGSTQNFLSFRELVAKGRSIVRVFESVSPKAADQNEPYDEDGHYAPLATPHSSPTPHSPLPDIERCYEESDVAFPYWDESNKINAERPGSASSNNISLPSLPSQLQMHKPDKKLTKHRRTFDTVKQIVAGVVDPEKYKQLMRSTDARLDCVTKVHIFREMKLMHLFNKPAHAFRELQPRTAAETASIMTGINRVKKAKRKEPNDVNMVKNFLGSFDFQTDVQADELQWEDLRRDDQPQRNHVNCRSIRKRFVYDATDSRPQSCNERLPQTNELCDLDFGYQEDEPMDEPDEVFIEPEPIPDPPERCYESPVPRINQSPRMGSHNRSVMVIPVDEPSLPIVNRSPIYRQEKSVMVNSASETRNFRLESENMPRSVLRLLNQETWGMKGVLQNLFRLWHKNVHPIGMTELLHPNRKKLAAAMAFYSIMELNSPRVGLITIEKDVNSNAVYNIAMSEKLVNLLSKFNRH